MEKRAVRKLVSLLILAAFLVSFVIPFIASECEENWVCSDWVECFLNGTKIKTCNDTNACNTTINIPPLIKDCGTNCSIDRECENWKNCTNGKQTRICYDTSTCSSAEQKVIDWQPCSIVNQTNSTLNATQNATLNETLNASEGKNLINASSCNGCVLEDKCLHFGARVEYDGKPRYCDSADGKVKSQKMKNLQGALVSCTNDYECISNVCDIKCVDLDAIMAEKTGFKKFWKKFLCKASSIFKSSGYERCLYAKFKPA